MRPLPIAFMMAAMLPACPGVAEPWIPPDNRLEFSIVRDGEEIGRQTIAFAQEGKRLVVDTRVEIKVKRLFVTVHRFERSARSVWRGGMLQSYTSSTDNNGTKSSLTVRPRGDALEIRTNGSSRQVARGLKVPELWNIDVLAAKTVINPVTGAVDEISVGPPEKTVLQLGNREFPARRYRLTGKTARDIWYDENGGLLQISRKARDGSTVVTRRLF